MESMQWPGMFEDDVLTGAENHEIFPTKNTNLKNVEFFLVVLCGESVVCLGSGLRSCWFFDVVDVGFCVPHEGSYTVTSQNIHYIYPNQRYVCSKKSIPNLKPT